MIKTNMLVNYTCIAIRETRSGWQVYDLTANRKRVVAHRHCVPTGWWVERGFIVYWQDDDGEVYEGVVIDEDHDSIITVWHPDTGVVAVHVTRITDVITNDVDDATLDSVLAKAGVA